MSNLFFATALLPQGWAHNVLVNLDAANNIATVMSDMAPPADASCFAGVALAGIPNLHSHAHQRAIAGLAERSGSGADSFWSWRDVMYRALDRIDPDAFEVIATQLYIEMAKAGFTAVAEFHYLHHDRDGRPYSDAAEMSHRIIAAARTAGLTVTLLPVFYATSGFDGAPTTPAQCRFAHTLDSFGSLITALDDRYGNAPDVRIGIAPHSLRAVPSAALAEIVALHPDRLMHIHVAEQDREVQDCLARHGQRPVEWLLNNHAVDRHWCLIHATHVTSSEVAALAASGAIVGLCPTTEANLGDGIFPTAALLSQSGCFGIGSDSNVSVSPVEDLRWLEYMARLTTRCRTVLAGGPNQSTARRLIEDAQTGGAAACGIRAGRIAPGYRADIVVLDRDHPLLMARTDDAWLDSWIFAGNGNTVRDVIVGGQTIIRDYHHRHEAAAARRFSTILGRLFR